MSEIAGEASACRRVLAEIRREIRVIKAMVVATGAGVYLLMLLEIIARARP